MKRLLDASAAFIGILLLSPLMLITALVVRIALGAPVLFTQLRPGRHERPFMLLKFRTMLNSRDQRGDLLSDEHRLHPVGTFLRRASLDELPQLWNVLKGEMSLVGPRPLLVEYLAHYTPVQARRHEARPGITGWAQIHGRQDIPFSQRLELDVWYVDNRSIRLDLEILAKTILKVFFRSGVRPGQDVREVDDLGLNTSSVRHKMAPELDNQEGQTK